MRFMPAPRRVVEVVFPGVDLLDVTGPAEVFASASHLVGRRRPGYTVELAGLTRDPVRTSSGVRLVPDLSLDEVGPGVDTLLVAGAIVIEGRGIAPVVDPDVVAWVKELAPQARRVASVCTGAHLLAAAGLLDGLAATTHWGTADRLAADHPQVRVDPDPIFVRSGSIWTGAGVSSGMDLALALVAEDHGEQVAVDVARWLVMYVKRPSGQSQFSVSLSQAAATRRDVDALRLWIRDNVAADLSAAALADRMHLSLRHFSRVFRLETGMTPAAFVEAARVEAARDLLETTDRSLRDIATACGLGSVETLHRAFRRCTGTTPAEYRRRLRVTASGPAA